MVLDKADIAERRVMLAGMFAEHDVSFSTDDYFKRNPGDPDQLPEAWIEAGNDPTIAHAVLAQMWRDNNPEFPRIAQWIDEYLIGARVSWATRPEDLSVSDGPIPEEWCLTYMFPGSDCLDIPSKTTSLRGLLPGGGASDDRVQRAMNDAGIGRMGATHDGFGGDLLHGWRPSDYRPSAYVALRNPEYELSHYDRDHIALPGGPALHEVNVVAQNYLIVVTVDVNRSDGFGWYGDPTTLQETALVDPLQDVISSVAGAYHYCCIFD